MYLCQSGDGFLIYFYFLPFYFSFPSVLYL